MEVKKKKMSDLAYSELVEENLAVQGKRVLLRVVNVPLMGRRYYLQTLTVLRPLIPP